MSAASAAEVRADVTYHNPEVWRPSLSQQEQQAISALHTLLDASAALTSTGGVLQHQATRLGFCDPAAGSQGGNDLRSLVFSDDTSVANAFEKCLPSSHGQGHKMVYDPAIRLARELPASHLFLPANIAACLNDIIFHLNKRMNLESLRLTLDKLSIYGPNGHFSSHKDTPQSELHVGTVLLGLPTAHTGGALLIGQGETLIRHDWSTLEKDKLGWVFFYADVDHEVEVVESGYRATLQFNAYRRPAHDDSPAAQQTAKPNVIDRQLSKMLQDGTFLPLGGRLAFLLKHEYPVANLDAADMQNYGRQDQLALSPEAFLGNLKGIDEDLLASLSRYNLKCRPLVVYRDDTFAEYYEDSSEGGDDMDGGSEESADQPWDGWVVKSRKEDRPKAQRTPKPSDSQRLYERICGQVTWVPPPAAFNYKSHGAPYGTYGNEPSTAYTYAKMGLVVELPSWEERAKGVPAQSGLDA